MSESNKLDTFQDNDKRAKRAIIWKGVSVATSIMLVVVIFLFIFLVGGAIYLRESAGDSYGGGLLVGVGLLVLIFSGLAMLGVYIAATIFYLMWVYRAHQNAEAISGKKLFLSAGWNVGFHFIPLANLIIPYLLMLQIAEKSSSKQAKNITLTWWILVLVSNGVSFLTNIISFISDIVYGYNNPTSSYSDSYSDYDSLFSGGGIVDLVGGSLVSLTSLAVFIISFFVIHLVNKGQKEKAKEMGLLSQ